MISREVDRGQSAKRTFADLSLHLDWFGGSQRIDDLDVQMLDLSFKVPVILKLTGDSFLQLFRIVIESRAGHAVGDLGQFCRIDSTRAGDDEALNNNLSSIGRLILGLGQPSLAGSGQKGRNRNDPRENAAHDNSDQSRIPDWLSFTS